MPKNISSLQPKLARERLVQIVKVFGGKKVSVVGDVMLDCFLYGRVERISQEAPVPVLELAEERYCLGGAANVAAHMLSYGASTNLTGLVGSDDAAKKLRAKMREVGVAASGLVEDNSRPTTEKTRVLAGSQQIVRLDVESREEASRGSLSALTQAALKSLHNSDALILVDYGKGVLVEALTRKILAQARTIKIPTLVNPKLEFKMYKGVTLFTPNEREIYDMTGEQDSASGARMLRSELGSAVLATEGARGMTLYDSDTPRHFDAQSREVFDEVGASDTVTATAAIALAAGASLVEAVYLANVAAGIAVGKRGVATVEREELLRAITEDVELK
jgi:rfaE bifunctional protein kinase chain/domain